MSAGPWVVSYLVGVAMLLSMHEELFVAASIAATMVPTNEKDVPKIVWGIIFLWPVVLIGYSLVLLAAWVQGDKDDPKD